ncbi:ComF family protein [Marinicrinis lubricantis]|uniref:ComF family protein n=1 Tax=Marinicrinis lubricantis TaxID=2086470 RepID=A0ABW1ISV5_9BACL
MKIWKALFEGQTITCMGCGASLSESIHGLCRRCASNIPWLSELKCRICGRDMDCPDCAGIRRQGFICNRSAVRYEEPIIDWMARYKYRGDEQLSALFGDLLQLAWKRLTHDIPKLRGLPVAVTYIPLSQERAMERGFNQTEQMAQRLSSLQGFKVFELLKRVRHTEKQSFKSRTERAESLKHVFGLNREEAGRLYHWASKQKKQPVIVMIDDIYTTGSTLREASNVVRGSIPLPIFCLTAARS